jgi:hypothetical protein
MTAIKNLDRLRELFELFIETLKSCAESVLPPTEIQAL